ncbi:hypothetical protein VE03_01191 [Pseudogymnoascus sp. 23342-1-I1]|nr:hypothetical protein VE03_01191 [Pseudogymnoascus sp. 23342-1-I1]
MSSSSSSATSDPETCPICGYPSWTEALHDGYDERMCSSFTDIHRSSTSGCLGCAVLVQAWEYGTPVVDERTNEYITFNRSLGNLYVHIFKHPHGVLNIDVFTIAHAPRFKHVRPGALIPSSTSLAENLARIQQWLRACEKMHGICSVPNHQAPPRLLDLECGSPDIIRLVKPGQVHAGSSDNKNANPDFRYACLSHCWGKARFKDLTTASNLEANMKGIFISDLPPTFRDSVMVSRALGIQYLWIDSLCIVQDDHVDWGTHVDKMAQIYRNAYITLAAGASSDDSGGLFRQAVVHFSSAFPFNLRDGEIEYKIYLRRRLPHPDEDWPTGAIMPLMMRGWVFQERLLSRRFLSFAANEVLWECLEDVACSCSTTTDGFNHYHQSERNPELEKSAAFPNCPPSKFEFAKIRDLLPEQLWSLWREFVTQYTQRSHTFPSDKLPALAGLAKEFQTAGAGDYAHGMWVDSIEKDISWQNKGYSDDGVRPRKAPSWSWVSAADGGIEWNRSDLQGSRMRIIRLVDQPRGSDIADEANRELLLLEGNIARISLREEEVTNGMEVYEGYRCCSVNKWSATNEQLDPDDVTPEPKSADSKTTSLLSNSILSDNEHSGSLWADYKLWSDKEKLWHILEDAFFLDLGTEKGGSVSYGMEGPDLCWAAGLILRAYDRELDGNAIYERIGWLRQIPHIFKEVKLMGGIYYTNEDFEDVLEDVASEKMAAKDMITSIVPLEKAIHGGFLELIHNKAEHVKILIQPSNSAGR